MLPHTLLLLGIAATTSIRSLADASDSEACIAGTADCIAPQAVKASSMLMTRGQVKKGKLVSDETCAPLELPAFTLEGCDSLAPGSSCKVSCPAGLLGEPVRYFCFTHLAETGAPPAALAPPVCHNATGSAYSQDKMMALAWGSKGCVQCNSARTTCDILADAGPGDERCTLFKLDPAQNRIMWDKHGQCVDMFGGPKVGLWGCNGGDNQHFEVEASSEYPGAKVICVSSGRGKICLNEVGSLPVRFFDMPPDASLLEPALAALEEGNENMFLHNVYANQICRARLESGVPDSFWDWLKTQDFPLVQALFSTYPVHPGQVKLFHEIREAVGAEKFESLGMASFALAVSYVNRFRSGVDDMMQAPHPNFEINDNNYLKEDKERIKQEMIDGEHCGIQSNECHNLHTCCGTPESWNFTWPRDPTPSVRDWVEFWVSKTAEHPEKLWMNPLKEVPWMFAVYIWPSPVEECEWVHNKLIDGEDMEGRWYLYDSSFHQRICAGGDYHPDSLPGIAVYGGVCGRMAQLEWRKTGCMGQPATMKGEPGHCAGFKYKSVTGAFTHLNVITDVASLFTLQLVPEVHSWVTLEVAKNSESFPNTTTSCIKCSSWSKCEFIPATSEDCSKFAMDTETGRFRPSTGGNMCLDMFGGPSPGLWRCGSGSNENQDFTENADGEKIIQGGRGKLRIKTHDVPPEPVVEECLYCKYNGRSCERALPNSTDCSKFEYDEGSQALRITHLGGKCLDQFSGPKPGAWSCNGGDNQKAPLQDDGLHKISSSRGTTKYEKFSVDAYLSELGRCVSCKSSWRACEFTTAGSEDCTEFIYNPSESRIEVGWGNQCLTMFSGPKPGLWGCSSTGDDANQLVELDEQGRLKFKSSRGTMHMHVPLGGALPNVTTRWSYSGIHEIACTQRNCHFNSVLHLDSKAFTEKRHKETALADFEAYNDHFKQGLFPTAHDEARLAASLVYALRKDGLAPDEDLEPVLAWALQRNPALFEAWHLAADFTSSPGGALNSSDMPSRDALKSHEWYNQLSLIRLGGASKREQEKAERFAREHLLGEKKRRWVQFPQLHRTMVGRICGALSDETLEELGEASEQCQVLRRLSQGLGWEDVMDEMLDADAMGHGNMPAEAFQMYWEALARLAVVPGHHGQGEKLTQLVTYLLDKLTVGFINERSQTFFAEHKRILLHGPYAHTLQLAGAVLSKEKREEILKSTKKLLEGPFDQPDKLWASSDSLKEGFLEWAARHASGGTRTIFEESSSVDSVNGYSSADGANAQIMEEMEQDRDSEMELGATFWHETWATADGDRRYETVPLLSSLLRLHDKGTSSPESTAEDGGLSSAASPAASLRQHRAVQRAPARAAPRPSELVQFCMDDLFSGP